MGDGKVPGEDHAGDEGNEHQVPRTVANNVISDRRVAAAGVPDIRSLHARKS
jgi:hypothetical protein